MLTDVIERPGFGVKLYDVQRQTASTVDGNGIVVPGALTTVKIRAGIQPATGRYLLVLSEGQRAQENRIGFTRTSPVYTREASPALEPDRFVIDGEPWIVFRVEHWEAFSGKHWRFWLARKVVP